ncbi:MAG: hypothetical protein M5U28_28890 [Sandaracinaceae bacterium]|nr:hypothetical protein [Sandaracinaceae bacterium]
MSMRAFAIATFVLLAGCEEPRWARVHDELPEALMGVWGRSSQEVYAVGSDAGSGPLVLLFDGARWTRLSTGASGDLWWVNGAPGGPIFFGGSGGLILSYDGATFTPMETPGTGTVFGIWAAASDDVWAVGGTLGRAGFAWRYDGTAWTEVEVVGLGDRGLNKVWGLAPDDVWLVGTGGAMFHWDGSALEAVDAGTTRALTTVHLEGERAVAVGGAGNAALVEREDGVWVDRSPEFVPALFGVWLTPDGGGWAVGHNGTIMRREPSGWVQEDPDIGYIDGALHAVWVDETGGAWAVGGQVISPPFSDGVMLHRGAPVPSGNVEEGP